MTSITTSITTADSALLSAGLATYTELVFAAKLALSAIDSRISAEDTEPRDEDRAAYEALCRALRGNGDDD